MYYHICVLSLVAGGCECHAEQWLEISAFAKCHISVYHRKNGTRGNKRNEACLIKFLHMYPLLIWYQEEEGGENANCIINTLIKL